MVLKEKLVRSPRISLLLITGVLLTGISLVGLAMKVPSYAQATNNCYASVSMYSSSGSTGMISGIAKVSVGLNTAISETPARVTILLNGREVGQARPEQTSSYHWILQLPTNLLDPSSSGYELKALIKYASFECVTPPTITPPIAPTSAAMFAIQPSTPLVELPVNTQALISANTIMPDTNINYSMYSLYSWAAEGKGVVSGTLDKQTTFFAGPNTGDGRIKVRVKYGFRESEAFIQTRILPTNSPIQTPTSSQTTAQTTSAEDNTTNASSSAADDPQVSEGTDSNQQSPAILQPTVSLESSSLTKECAETALGTDRFLAINSGQVRPTLSELEKLKACFARSNYIIPSNFAPVAPKEVANLPTGSNIKIIEIKNEKKIVADTQKDVIKLSGTAAPKSTVIIYVFSEPLVLTTTADDNGEWVYELENPIESGEHTMYAVVDRGDGVYEKTDPLKFAIGTAEASAENPAGLSLILNEEETAKESLLTTGLYIVSTAILLGAITLTAYLAYKKGKTSSHDKLEPATVPIQSTSLQPTASEAPSTNASGITENIANTSQIDRDIQALPHQPGHIVTPSNSLNENVTQVAATPESNEKQQV